MGWSPDIPYSSIAEGVDGLRGHLFEGEFGKRLPAAKLVSEVPALRPRCARQFWGSLQQTLKVVEFLSKDHERSLRQDPTIAMVSANPLPLAPFFRIVGPCSGIDRPVYGRCRK